MLRCLWGVIFAVLSVSVAIAAPLRTVVYIKKETVSGQDIFARGGIDHSYAQQAFGWNCTAANWQCAVPITHRISITDPNRANDKYLDWYGGESGQSQGILGSPLAWTINSWPAAWGAKKTLVADGYGEDPENAWGAHYWKLDVTRKVILATGLNFGRFWFRVERLLGRMMSARPGARGHPVTILPKKVA
jgi:hypothetical protein